MNYKKNFKEKSKERSSNGLFWSGYFTLKEKRNLGSDAKEIDKIWFYALICKSRSIC